MENVFIHGYHQESGRCDSLSFSVASEDEKMGLFEVAGLAAGEPSLISKRDGTSLATGITDVEMAVRGLLKPLPDDQPGYPKNLRELAVAARYWEWARLMYD